LVHKVNLHSKQGCDQGLLARQREKHVGPDIQTGDGHLQHSLATCAQGRKWPKVQVHKGDQNATYRLKNKKSYKGYLVNWPKPVFRIMIRLPESHRKTEVVVWMNNGHIRRFGQQILPLEVQTMFL
jgi:hypothetical protein